MLIAGSRNKLRFLAVSLSLIFLIAVFSIYKRIPVIESGNIVISLELNSISNQLPPRYPSSVTSLPKSLDNFEEVEIEIKERIDRVNKLCQIHHLGRYKWTHNSSNDLNIKEPPTPLYSYFFWNRERNLGWCPVYKAGSTSWLYNMMILAGVSSKELEHPSKQLSALARQVYGDSEPDQKTVDKSLKLLVVRHPFERLLSAYIDKLSNSTVGKEHGSFHFYTKYGKKIVQKYRKNHNKNKEPTWEEFVRYLINTSLIHYSDDHWLPAYYSCTPCLIDYDVIAKVETYSRDQAYIIQKTGLQNLIKPRWNHKLKSNEEDKMKKYFGELSKNQIEKLYRKYYLDFELFGYDHKEYLKYGREE